MFHVTKRALIGLLIILLTIGPSSASAYSTIEEEYSQVSDYILSLNLDLGIENALISKLDASLKSFNEGKMGPCVNQLKAIINQVDAQAGKKISAIDAYRICALVNSLTDRIEGNLEYIEVGLTINGGLEEAQILADIATNDVNDWLRATETSFRVVTRIMDNEGSSDKALQNVIDLNAEGIDIIIGHPSSGQCQASLPYINENKVFMISASSTDPGLQISDDNLLRAVPPDGFFVERLMDFYKTTGVKAFALLYRDDGFGHWMRDSIISGLDPEVELITIVEYPCGERDYSEYLQEVDSVVSEYLIEHGLSPDEVVLQFVDSGDEIGYAVESAEQGDYSIVDQLKWYRSESTNLSQDMLMRIGDMIVDYKLFAPLAMADVESPSYQSVYDRYLSLTGDELSFYSAATYDIFWIISNAILETGSYDAMVVKDAILDLYYKSEPLPEPLTALTTLMVSLMEDGSTSYDGISGEIFFDANGDRTGTDYTLEGYAWVDGVLDTAEYASYDEGTETTETYTVEETPPQIITIGATSSADGGILQAQDIIALAKSDINQQMLDEGLPYWFDFELLHNHASDEVALDTIIEFDLRGINLVSGHGWSSQCAGSLDYITLNDMLLFSCSSTSPLLAIDDNLFRLVTNDDVSGNVIVDLYELHDKQAVVIVYRDDNYGQGLKDVISEECTLRGIAVLDTIPYNGGDVDWSNVLSSAESVIEDNRVQYGLENIAFEIVAFSELFVALNELESNDYPNLENMDWYGADSSADNIDIENNALAMAMQVKLYSCLQAPLYDDPLFTDLKARYEDLNGGNLGFYPAARYDIFRLLAQAIVNTGTTDTETIKTELRVLTSPAPGYYGVSGYSMLDEYGDRIGADYDIWIYGYDGDQYGSVVSGFYDVESDSITEYTLPTPPSLALVNPEIWNWNGYRVTDSGDQWPSFRARTGVSSEYGLDAIDTVTFEFPDGSVYELVDDEWMDDDPPYNGIYLNEFELDNPIYGPFTFQVTDIYDNSDSATLSFDSWITDTFTSITPQYNAWIPSSDDLMFSWDFPVPDVHFAVHIWNDTVDYRMDVDGNSHDYEGEWLEDGLYEFAIDVWDDEGGHMAAFSQFYIGSPPILTEAEVTANTQYWIFDSEPNLNYEAEPRIRILTDNYDAVNYVKIISPNDEEYYLEPIWDEDHPWRLGEYRTHFDVDEPLYGTYVFEIDYDGAIITQEFEVSNWLTEPFETVQPSTLSSYLPGEVIEFSWEYPYDFDQYYVQIRSDSYEYDWEDETEGNSLDYTVPEIEEGVYRFTISGEKYGEVSLQARGEFLIGSMPLITDVDVFTWMDYRFWEPENKWYAMNLYLSVFVDDYDSIDYVKAVFPDGEYMMERDWDEFSDPRDIGRYYVNMNTDEPFIGTIDIKVSYLDETYIESVEVTEWLLEEYDFVDPAPGDYYETSNDLIFSWGLSCDDVQNFELSICNDDGWIYDVYTEDSFHEYMGVPLAPGRYEYIVRSHTAHISGVTGVVVHSYFFIGSP